MSLIDITVLNPEVFQNTFFNFELVRTRSPGTRSNCFMALSTISKLSVSGILEVSNFE